MIQRLQTIFFFLSSISILVIIKKYPVLQEIEFSGLDQEYIRYFFLYDDYEAHFKGFKILKSILFISAGLSFFGIFQYRNLQRQKIIAMIARFLITLVLVLLVFLFRNEEQEISIGTFLLAIPFVLLICANIFLKKDEKLISSADRIR